MQTNIIINPDEIIKIISSNQNIVEFINNKIKEFIKWFLELILNIEFEMFREGLKHKRHRQRNGYYERNLITNFGLIEKIRVPRYRGIRFFNSLFKPWQRRWEKVEETIVKFFIQGESYRDIRRIVGEIFGDKTISISTISKITDKFIEEVNKFHQRKITEKYSIIWIDGIYFSVKGYQKNSKKRKNFCVLVALGLKKDTKKKEIIDFMLTHYENKSAYMNFINSLLDRGLNIDNLEVIVHDGDQAIKSALNKIFGDIVKQQDCIFHKLQNINNAIKNKQIRRSILRDASKVYKSIDYEQYLQRKKEFINKYKNIEPHAVKVFSDDMFIKTKFSLDVHLYHWINTTTPIDRMFREVRRRTNAIGCFENRKSLNKIFFFIINFINEILGNASFSKKLALTQF